MIIGLPEELRSVLWDLDFERLDPEIEADSIIARVLEHGRLSEVRRILEIYGPERSCVTVNVDTHLLPCRSLSAGS